MEHLKPNHIVDWSVIERCRSDYEISRVHLEHAQIIEKFGEFIPNSISTALSGHNS